MDSSQFELLFDFFLGPQAAAGLIGLIGLVAYFLTEKKLKNLLEEDDFILASSGSIRDSVFAAFLIIQAGYGLITTIFVVIFAWGYSEEMLFFYTWISFDDTATWNAKVSLVGLFFGGLLYSFGFVLSAMNYLNIAKLKNESRLKLITGELTAQHEPSPSQTDEDLPLLRVLQAFLAAGLLLGGGDFFVRVILFAGFLKVSLRIWRFEPPQVTDDDPLEASDDTDQTEPDEERTEPVTFAEILEALDAQLKEAIEEAHDLREELEETKTKVITLEEEVQEKDVLIGEIEASKTTLTKEIDREEKEEREGKKLSLTDSVMVGDSIMGGMKVGSQVNNDPDAIARAVIAAYRAGREDKE